MKKMQIFKRLTLAFLFLSGGSTIAFAQVFGGTVAAPVTLGTPQFFICIIAGVLLAIGFQVLLTILTAASGVSLVGDVNRFNHQHQHKNAGQHDRTQHNQSNSKTPVISKISTGLGIWTLITVSLSLFFASLLAVRLSLLEDNTIGVTLGLVIWAAFFTLMAYLEMKSVSTLIGAIFKTALQGLRSSFSAVSSVFSSSPESRTSKAIEDTATTIRQEITAALDNSTLAQKMEDYLDKLETQEPDYQRMRKEIAGLLDDVELREVSERGENGELVKRTFLDIAQQQPHLSKQQVQKLSQVFDEAKSIARSEGSSTDKALRAVDKFTPGSEEDTRRFREQVADYLRQSGRSELSVDAFKQDLEAIIQSPGSTPEIVRNRVSQLDRDSIVALLAAHPDVPQERANQIVSYAEKAVATIKQKFTNTQAASAPNSMTDMVGKNGPTSPNQQDWKGRFEDKVRNYFNSMERPEMSYDRIKGDFERILHDPSSTFQVLKSRLGQLDRNSLVALLSSRENVSRADAEKMVSKIEEARDSVMQKAEKVEHEVSNRLAQAQEVAFREAENVRKAAATAAWWLFATAVVSGVAAAIGGALAIRPEIILFF